MVFQAPAHSKASALYASGTTSTPQELIERERLHGVLVPVHFRIMTRADLPVTATGKVQKIRLQELPSATDRSPGSSEPTASIRRVVR